MKMIMITKVNVEMPDDCGCNNGVHATYEIEYDTGRGFEPEEFKTIRGMTCRCGNGCHGTDRLPEEGMTFKNITSLIDWMKN